MLLVNQSMMKQFRRRLNRRLRLKHYYLRHLHHPHRLHRSLHCYLDFRYRRYFLGPEFLMNQVLKQEMHLRLHHLNHLKVAQYILNHRHRRLLM
jgi:hypothetical protein